MESLKKLLSDSDAALWALALVCVTVLVAVGKAPVTSFEMLVMAVVGRAGMKALPGSKAATPKE